MFSSSSNMFKNLAAVKKQEDIDPETEEFDVIVVGSGNGACGFLSELQSILAASTSSHSHQPMKILVLEEGQNFFYNEGGTHQRGWSKTYSTGAIYKVLLFFDIFKSINAAQIPLHVKRTSCFLRAVNKNFNPEYLEVPGREVQVPCDDDDDERTVLVRYTTTTTNDEQQTYDNNKSSNGVLCWSHEHRNFNRKPEY